MFRIKEAEKEIKYIEEQLEQYIDEIPISDRLKMRIDLLRVKFEFNKYIKQVFIS